MLVSSHFYSLEKLLQLANITVHEPFKMESVPWLELQQHQLCTLHWEQVGSCFWARGRCLGLVCPSNYPLDSAQGFFFFEVLFYKYETKAQFGGV